MYLMWCSPTASPHTQPRTVFFPASVVGFLSISRTLTFPLPFRAIVPAVIQPAMPAPTTTTSQFSAKFFTTLGVYRGLVNTLKPYASQLDKLRELALYHLRRADFSKQGDSLVCHRTLASMRKNRPS